MSNLPKSLNQNLFKMKIIEDTWVIHEYKPKTKRKAIFECTKCLKHFSIRVEKSMQNQELCQSCANSKRATKHGNYKEKTYNQWDGQRSRCNNLNHRDYKNYGKRGITFHPLWKNNYPLYRTYVLSLSNAEEPGRTIDRIHNNYGYEPMNLRWATHKEQATNKRNTNEKNKSGI